MVVKGLLYTKDHEWAKIEGDIAIIGITDHAQNQLGELTFVELPDVGKEIKQKGELAVVESSKAASDVYSPVTGKVIEANTKLENKSGNSKRRLLRRRLDLQNPDNRQGSTQNLIDAAQYEILP